jgi:HTH-type transcriptional regulator / antitoxin HigA
MGNLKGGQMQKVIKSNSEYEAALREIESLMDCNTAPGSPEGERLELLGILISDYESKKFESRLPDPIEAIRFRMEQQGLSRRDLIPLIGSRSKVSEVLARKRPLTLSMIRALHSGLAIPAGVLLQGQREPNLNDGEVEWNRFPIREMAGRGWIDLPPKTDPDVQAEGLMHRFFSGLGPTNMALAFYRQTRSIRSARPMDKHALIAWTARVVMRARKVPRKGAYAHGTVTLKLMRELARLSSFESGPRLAVEFLGGYGISLVIEPQLPRTHLDGCAILAGLDTPVIGMTLRHDRVDNFWFCLMHELAHVTLHLGEGSDQFLDDLDIEKKDDPRERQADALAGEALIPESEWQKSPASRIRTPEAVELLARQLGIHPAIVAGRIRHHFKSYRVLNQFVGHGQIRGQFPEIDWETGRLDVRS